jgi:hypothetical protein
MITNFGIFSKWGGSFEKNFPDSSLPLWEIIKVRGERIFINPFFSFSPLAGENKSEGCRFIFSINFFPLLLQERVRVRSAVKFYIFYSPFKKIKKLLTMKFDFIIFPVRTGKVALRFF